MGPSLPGSINIPRNPDDGPGQILAEASHLAISPSRHLRRDRWVRRPSAEPLDSRRLLSGGVTSPDPGVVILIIESSPSGSTGGTGGVASLGWIVNIPGPAGGVTNPGPITITIPNTGNTQSNSGTGPETTLGSITFSPGSPNPFSGAIVLGPGISISRDLFGNPAPPDPGAGGNAGAGNNGGADGGDEGDDGNGDGGDGGGNANTPAFPDSPSFIFSIDYGGDGGGGGNGGTGGGNNGGGGDGGGTSPGNTGGTFFGGTGGGTSSLGGGGDTGTITIGGVPITPIATPSPVANPVSGLPPYGTLGGTNDGGSGGLSGVSDPDPSNATTSGGTNSNPTGSVPGPSSLDNMTFGLPKFIQWLVQ